MHGATKIVVIFVARRTGARRQAASLAISASNTLDKDAMVLLVLLLERGGTLGARKIVVTFVARQRDVHGLVLQRAASLAFNASSMPDETALVLLALLRGRDD